VRLYIPKTRLHIGKCRVICFITLSIIFFFYFSIRLQSFIVNSVTNSYPSIRGTSVRILLITSSLCWCVAGADCSRNGRQRPPRSRTATRNRTGANSRHLLRGLSSLRSLLLPLLGESSHGGGSRTVPLQGATSGSSVRHVVWKKKHEIVRHSACFSYYRSHWIIYLVAEGIVIRTRAII